MEQTNAKTNEPIRVDLNLDDIHRGIGEMYMELIRIKKQCTISFAEVEQLKQEIIQKKES